MNDELNLYSFISNEIRHPNLLFLMRLPSLKGTPEQPE